MFASSLVDKYVQQNGATFDLRYNFAKHWGIGGSFSFFSGGLTDIVTGSGGVLGNKVAACRADTSVACDLSLRVPDTKQVTGSLDLMLIWLPLYGKLNIVSELDSDIQLHLLAGGGVNGTRSIVASADLASDKGYVLTGNGFGEGGAFAGAQVHGTIGVGATLWFTRRLALRGELRSIIWRESIDQDGDGVTSGYISWRHLGMIGLVVTP